jgi:hypothetical protein
VLRECCGWCFAHSRAPKSSRGTTIWTDSSAKSAEKKSPVFTKFRRGQGIFVFFAFSAVDSNKEVFAFFEHFAVQSPFSVFFPFLHSAFSLQPLAFAPPRPSLLDL